MTAYLLSELLWESVREKGGFRFHRNAETGSLAVRLFLDPTQAEEQRIRRERISRLNRNPFQYGANLEDWTSLQPELLYDWILEMGLEPLPSIKPSQTQCIEWWNRERPEMTVAEAERVWEALDRVRFFQVTEEAI